MAYQIADQRTLYTEGAQAKVTPLFVQPVSAGDGWGCELDLHFETARTTKRTINPLFVTFDAWAVPFRLIDPTWVDFFSDPDTVATMPTTTVAFPELYEPAAANITTFLSYPRRAYKLGYNEFFGQEDLGSTAWYANVLDDTVVTLGRAPNPEAYARRMKRQLDVTNLTYDIPSVPHSIDYSVFSRGMKSQRAHVKRELTGDRYVDALRRLGINIDTAMLTSPARLEHKSFFVAPAITTSSGAASTDLGKQVSRYTLDTRISMKRRFYPEAMMLVAVLTCRAMAPNQGTKVHPMHVATGSFNWLGRDTDIVNNENVLGLAAANRSNPYLRLYAGLSQFNGTSWLGKVNETTTGGYMYPAASDVPFATDELASGANFAVCMIQRQVGQTQLNPSLIDRIAVE